MDDEMGSSRTLPIVVDVPNPCDVDWEDMVGNERGRFCGRCGKTVTNLSVLDGNQVLAVLERGDCVSFLYRSDASVVTAPSRAAGGTGAVTTAAAVVLAASMALTLGCDATRTSDEPAEPTRVTSEACDAAGGQEKQSGATTGAQVQTEANGPPASASASATAERAPSAAPVVRMEELVEPEPRELPRRTAGVPMRRDRPGSPFTF